MLDPKILKMACLDPDIAVRMFLAEKIDEIEFTRPDGSGLFDPTVFLDWPSNPSERDIPGLFIEPRKVSESEYLGDGEFVPDTENAVVQGLQAFDLGEVDVSFSILGLTTSRDERDIMIYQLRRLFADDVRTDGYEKYFGQPIKVQKTAFSRLEGRDYAERGLRAFEIEGEGMTTDIILKPIRTTTIKTELEFE